MIALRFLPSLRLVDRPLLMPSLEMREKANSRYGMKNLMTFHSKRLANLPVISASTSTLIGIPHALMRDTSRLKAQLNTALKEVSNLANTQIPFGWRLRHLISVMLKFSLREYMLNDLRLCLDITYLPASTGKQEVSRMKNLRASPKILQLWDSAGSLSPLLAST